MKKLLVFMLVFCGCAAVLSAKNKPKSEALAKKINAEAVKQQQQATKEAHASVQFSHSVMSDSLRPHELQHARPPCPSPVTPEAYSNVHQVGDATQPSHPLLSPSPPTFNLSQHQGLFK